MGFRGGHRRWAKEANRDVLRSYEQVKNPDLINTTLVKQKEKRKLAEDKALFPIEGIEREESNTFLNFWR